MKVETRKITLRPIYDDEWWAVQQMRLFNPVPVMIYQVYKQESKLSPSGEIKRIQVNFNVFPQEIKIKLDEI